MVMLGAMIVRSETPGDEPAVYEVIAAAFSQIEEANLVESLRATGDLEVSLVAEDDHKIIAHVALSKMKSPLRALALAPVSVIPPRQRQGIGTRLVRDALSRAEGCRLGSNLRLRWAKILSTFRLLR